MASVYPTSLDTTDTLYIAVNGLLYTLSSDIDSNVVTVPVNEDTQAAPATGYLSVVGGEAIHYSSKTQFSFTGCTRHDDGTSASSHKHNDQLKVGLVAAHHNSLVTAVLALEAKVGSGNTGIDGSKMKDSSITPAKMTIKPKVLAVGSIAGPINTSFTFTPQSSTSDILVAVSLSGYSTAAILRTVNYTLDGGAQTFLTKLFFNQTATHHSFPVGYVKLSNLPVALHTLAIVPPAGLSSDGNDTVDYSVIEFV